MTRCEMARILAETLARFKGNPRRYHESVLAQNSGTWFDWEQFVGICYKSILKSGCIGVDCGANHGTHTIRIAQVVAPGGRVISIDPVPIFHDNIRQLEKAFNIPEGIVTHLQYAVSDQDGVAEFFQVLDLSSDGLSGLRHRSYLEGRPVSTFPVETKTLDEICANLPRLDFIKLDIEGAELCALRGARKTLARFRPVITLEQDQASPSYFNYTWKDLLCFLDAAGYRLFDLFGFSYRDASLLDGCLVWDFVAFPEEQSPALAIWDIRLAMRQSGVML